MSSDTAGRGKPAIVSAMVLLPRRPKVIEEDTPTVRRLVKEDGFTANRTGSIRYCETLIL
jgi:hypothetical protein